MAAVTVNIVKTVAMVGPVIQAQAAEAITAGELVYQTASGTFGVADAADEDMSQVAGIALTACDVGTKFALLQGDGNELVLATSITGITDGTPYYLGSGANEGKLVTLGDLTTNDYIVLVAFYDTDTSKKFTMKIYATGNQV